MGMSTASVNHSASPASGPYVGPAEQDADTQLVLETRNQIRALVDEIRRLSESDVSLPQFYDGLLNRVVSALAATGGAMWTLDDEHRPQLAYSINLESLSDSAATRHVLLLRRVVRDALPLA